MCFWVGARSHRSSAPKTTDATCSFLLSFFFLKKIYLHRVSGPESFDLCTVRLDELKFVCYIFARFVAHKIVVQVNC